MTTPPRHAVIIVPSVSHAVKGERALTRAGIPNKLIPVPRTLSSQCGVCLRIDAADRERAEQALAAARLEISAVHDLELKAPDKETRGE